MRYQAAAMHRGRFLPLLLMLGMSFTFVFAAAPPAHASAFFGNYNEPDPFDFQYGGVNYAFSTAATLPRCSDGANVSMYVPVRVGGGTFQNCFTDALPTTKLQPDVVKDGGWAPTVFQSDDGNFVM